MFSICLVSISAVNAGLVLKNARAAACVAYNAEFVNGETPGRNVSFLCFSAALVLQLFCVFFLQVIEFSSFVSLALTTEQRRFQYQTFKKFHVM
jgi:hypothetical protein